MFTRRTATVTISAPLASTARRVSSKFLYLPVPTISRERYSRPASTNGSFNICFSTSADELYDLDAIAVADRPGGVLGARHDVAIHLDRDPTASEAKLREQVGDRSTVGDEPLLSVDDHGHES